MGSQKVYLKELHTVLHQRGYPTTLINKGFKLPEKVPQKNYGTQKSTTMRNPRAYVTTYNKNNPELFTEIIKNLEGLQNNDKIKEILDTTKIIKSQSQPKNLKRRLTSSTF